jgi:amino acid transporter
MIARRMGLFLLVVYGVGDMVGSGIYGTIGEAAAGMGNAVWLAFVASMFAALFTGLSYASLASRYPRAAGAAYITQRAYRLGFLSYVVGLSVTASGLTSMATNSNVFARTLTAFLEPVPILGAIEPWLAVLVFLGVMTFINFWGIQESMWTNVLCTAVEVGGLLFVIAVGARFWGSVNYLQTPPPAAIAGAGAPGGGLDLWLITSGAVLTFFAFVGFEDMLNVAEEVKDPRRTMPWGIVVALSITTLLYLATSITAVSVVSYRDLGDATRGAPLAQVTDRAAPWLPGWIFEGVTLFAAANSVLINYIMGSRMLYGMARQGLLPSALGRVHRSRHTPHVAILTLLAVVIVLAVAGEITELASATSLLLLMVFCIVNAGLIVLKYRPGEERGAFEVPSIVPLLGVLCCGGLIAARLGRVFSDPAANWQAPTIAGGLVILIGVVYVVFVFWRGRPGESIAVAE